MKLVGDADRFTMLQLSVEVLLTRLAVMDAVPFPFRKTERLMQFASGLIVSKTETTELQVEV